MTRLSFKDKVDIKRTSCPHCNKVFLFVDSDVETQEVKP